MKRAAFALLLALTLSSLARAASPTVLLYYAVTDAFNGFRMNHVKLMLQNKYGAGNVTVIDTGASQYDPTPDNWNAFDQVWDLRFQEAGSACGDATHVDRLDGNWQAKANAYMSNCGNFFAFGENSGFQSRSEGLVAILNNAGATTGLLCSDNSQGSSSPLATTLPGAPSLITGFYGGILQSKMSTGTPFIVTNSLADGLNHVVAAGFAGAADLPGLAAGCNTGKLFTVWDQNEWGGPGYDGVGGTVDQYFGVVADWLGVKACACGTPTVTPTPSPSPSLTPADSATPTPIASDTASPTASPIPQGTLTATPTRTLTATRTASPVLPAATATAEPLLLSPLPSSPNPGGPDGVHIAYRLSTAATVTMKVYTVAGEPVRDLPTGPHAAGPNEDFWDSRNNAGSLSASGVFLVKIHASSPAGESQEIWVKVTIVR